MKGRGGLREAIICGVPWRHVPESGCETRAGMWRQKRTRSGSAGRTRWPGQLADRLQGWGNGKWELFVVDNDLHRSIAPQAGPCTSATALVFKGTTR
jgi:hypothetical protein